MKLDFNEQAKLNGQAQDIQIDQTYTLNFMNQKTFDITTNCLKVSSHLHNDSQYCTVVFHGLASFTFELEENKPMQYTQQFSGMIGGYNSIFEVKMEL